MSITNEIYTVINLGFSVADANNISFRYDEGNLVLSFIDWTENKVSVKFLNTIGFRYQDAEYFNSENERFDSCHKVKNSKWLDLHKKQNMTWENEDWAHYKLNFNAGGIIEIICSNVVKL